MYWIGDVWVVGFYNYFSEEFEFFWIVVVVFFCYYFYVLFYYGEVECCWGYYVCVVNFFVFDFECVNEYFMWGFGSWDIEVVF